MRRSRSIALLCIGAVMTGAGFLIGYSPALDSSELRTVDWRFAVRGAQPRHDDIVVVQIDEQSHRELDVNWPIPRSLHAKVIDRLDAAGVKVIAYDVQFTEQTEVEEDNALIEAVHATRGRIVLATGDVTQHGDTEVLGGTEQVEALGSRVGHILFPRDRDGVVRRLRRQVNGVPGLAVAAVEVARRRAVPRSNFDAGGTAWIDFAGPPGTLRTVSFSDVLRGRIDAASFRGAVVVVGALAAEVHDVHPTATGRATQMSGAELNANAIATLLEDAPLRQAPGWLTPVLMVAFGLLVPLATIRFGSIAVAIVAAVALVYVGILQFAFAMGLILPALDPLVTLALSGAGVFAVLFASVSAERDAARQALGLFVPGSAVGPVVHAWAEGGDLRNLTETTETTCMFCDLRGFTRFAEMLDDDDAQRVLNRYLTEMSDSICAHQGTIVGYRGDGIVALFGAPKPQDDHADNAIRAARDMIGPRLDALNGWIAESNLGEGFDMGIGINSGTLRSGIIGSAGRLEYTAVGDAANVASRLEKESKEHPQQVLISGTTVAVLRHEKPSLVYVGTIQVDGRTAPVSIYGLNGSPVA